jgi:hypothetical protein
MFVTPFGNTAMPSHHPFSPLTLYFVPVYRLDTPGVSADGNPSPHTSALLLIAGEKYKEKIPVLTPYDMGPFHLCDRIVYAPLTRCRAIGTVPQPAAIEYYTQRARKGGFMLSEGTSPSRNGYGCVASTLPTCVAETSLFARSALVPSVGPRQYAARTLTNAVFRPVSRTHMQSYPAILASS